MLAEVQVEVQKRENERQAAQRVRTHTHLRERTEREEAVALKVHHLDEGHTVLQVRRCLYLSVFACTALASGRMCVQLFAC